MGVLPVLCHLLDVLCDARFLFGVAEVILPPNILNLNWCSHFSDKIKRLERLKI